MVLNRYSRQIILPEIGIKGQQKIGQAKVLVVGAGGLGCPALLYLTAAGIGTIGIIDNDIVDESNLQRQIIFDPKDIGRLKVEVVLEKLFEKNPLLHLISHISYLTSRNALEIIKNYDLVIDGSDNFPTRYLINDACVILKKPFIYGSVYKFEGQVSVFNYQDGPTYRCLFPEPPNEGEMLNCSEIGVLGVLPGVIGTLQAAEATKIITDAGDTLSGKLMIMDLLKNCTMYVDVPSVKANKKITRLSSYDIDCESGVKDISALELKERLAKGEDLYIIDVREPYEYERVNLKGSLIPLGTLEKNFQQIPKNKTVVAHCEHGQRSIKAIQYLQEQHGFRNLLNLKGGIQAWLSLHNRKPLTKLQ